MVKLKSLLKEWNDTSFKSLPKRWSKPIDSFRDEKFDGLTELERKEGIAQPTRQKPDFSKPTLVNLSRKELEILYTTGRIEADGITIIYED